MGSSLVIVAIPDENDLVWKISSEKVPHLTLLFLGDVDKVANLEQIMMFVEHAASTTLHRFYLPVDHRGELGADQADVLFFKKGRHDYRMIRDFRAALLQDSNIKTAYDSATQFDGVWQPHLTLGYPATPAQADNPDYTSLYEVCFHKIAVWTENFNGPEFLLKDQWDEFEALETVPMDVAMSAVRHAAKVSDAPWSQFKTSDYTDEQYARACLLDRGEEAGTPKQRYGLPVREPDGTLNRNACHAAAAVLSAKGGTGSARGTKLKGSPEAIAVAKRKLVALYNGPLSEDVPEGLGGEAKQTADMGSEYILEHFGVKGMQWGVTRTDRKFAKSVKLRTKAEKLYEKGTSRSGEAARKKVIKANELEMAVTRKVMAQTNKAAKKDMAELRKRPEFQNINFKDSTGKAQFDVSKYKKYEVEASKVWVKHLNQTTSGYKFGVDTNAGPGWRLTPEKIEHADTPFLRVNPILDDDGYIVDVQLVEENEVRQSTIERGEEFLEHYGTKGMKWGVRKQETAKGGHIRISQRTNVAAISSGGQVTALLTPFGIGVFLHPRFRAEYKAAGAHNKLAREDKKWKKRIDKSKRAVDVHNTAADEINSKIKDFNNDKRWKDADGKDIDLTKNPTKQKEYDDAAMKELLNPAYANAAVKVYGSNSPSGRYKFEINDASTGTLKLKDTLREDQVTHADEDNEEIEVRFRITRDANGHILGFKPEDSDTMEHSISDLGEAFILEHYGIKGMRWGVRRERPTAVAPTARSVVPHGKKRKTKIKTEGGEHHEAHDDAIKVAEARAKLKRSGTAALSNQELRDVANRLQLEAQVATLTTSRGQKFVMRELEVGTRQTVKKGVKKGIKKGGPIAGKKIKKAAATAAVAALL